MVRNCCIALLVVVASFAGLAQAAESPSIKAIVGGTIVDLDRNAPIWGAVIVIEHNDRLWP